jgi:tryptophan synthase alpha chain
MSVRGGELIASSIRAARERDGLALVPYVTAGFPEKAALRRQIESLDGAGAAVIEVGVPFTDPMADGVTIQRSSRAALAQGVTLEWILSELAAVHAGGAVRAPRVIMSYLNPLLNVMRRGLGAACAGAGVSACIIPDLPIEEAEPIRAELHAHGVGLVQLVSPVTPAARADRLAKASDGFVYAVMHTGVTGGGGAGGAARSSGAGGPAAGAGAYLAMIRSASATPVCAGFGLRRAEQVAALRGVCDGAIVGSALIEAVERGEDAGAFLRGLRAG